MQNENCGDFRSYLSIYSVCAATIAAFVPNAPETKFREVVFVNLEDARDFVTNKKETEYATAMIADLKSGMSFSQLRQKYSPNFPQNEIDLVKDLGRQF